MPGQLISVLFDDVTLADGVTRHPLFFGDLSIEQIVDGISGRRTAHSISSFFSLRPEKMEHIRSRNEVFGDLREQDVFESADQFCRAFQLCLSYLEKSNKLYNKRQKERWLLDAAGVYVDSVVQFAEDLSHLILESKGLRDLASYIQDYVSSAEFSNLRDEVKALQSSFAQICYNLLIKANRITVLNYDDELDFSREVEETFERFRQGVGKDYKVNFRDWPDMNRVEEEILDIVVKMNPEVFKRAEQFAIDHADFIDETIARFDREVQFYLAYIEQMRELEELGLEFCYPVLSTEKKEFHISGGFDLALAQRLAREGKAAVCNDYDLGPDERVIVVSGPNSGGKTTYARAFGQINYLASLGCPVPARKAELFFCDQIFTHFEREEDLDNLRGKLEDELIRIHEILENATSSSLVIMNESFGSTALGDATLLGRSVLQQLIDRGATCLCVTFIDELSRISDATVSMVAKVLPEDPTIRTFEIEARPADGLAYASAIAEKYRLGYESVKKRIEE